MKLPAAIYGAILVCVTAIGPTMFILPTLIPNTPYGLSLAIMLPVFCVMLFSALQIANLTAELPSGASFDSIVKHYLGKTYYKAARIIILSIIISLIYSNICGLKIIFDIANQLHAGSLISILFILMIYAITKGLIKYVQSLLSIAFICILTVCILYFHLTVESESSQSLITPLYEYQWYFLIPAIQASFSFHVLVPSIVNICNKKKEDYQKAIILGMVITFIIYILWITFTWSHDFGIVEHVNSQTQRKDIHPLSSSTHALFLIALVSSSLGLGIAAVDYAKDLSKTIQDKISPHYILCAILIIPFALFTFTPTGFQAGVLFSVFGSTFLAIILPSAIVLAKTNKIHSINFCVRKRYLSSMVLAYGLSSLFINFLRLTYN